MTSRPALIQPHASRLQLQFSVHTVALPLSQVSPSKNTHTYTDTYHSPTHPEPSVLLDNYRHFSSQRMTKKTLLLSSSPQGFGLKASQHLVEDFETRAVFFFLFFSCFFSTFCLVSCHDCVLCGSER